MASSYRPPQYRNGPLSISQMASMQNPHMAVARALSESSSSSVGGSTDNSFSSDASSSSALSSSACSEGSNNDADPSMQRLLCDNGIPLLHFLCKHHPTNRDIIQASLMQDVSAACRPASLFPFKRNGISTTAGGGDGLRVNVSISAATVAKLLKLSQSQVVPFLRGVNYTERKIRGKSKHPSPKQRSKPAARTMTNKTKAGHRSAVDRPDFDYPVNIAISNGATADVVRVLATAAPGILLKPEANGSNSLMIALHKQPQNHALVKVLLQCTPQLAFGKDRRGNTPLHWAIQRGSYCSLQVIKALYNANPKAVMQANFCGETPFQTAQRNALVAEDVVDFLHLCHDQQIHSHEFDDDNDRNDIAVTTKRTINAAYHYGVTFDVNALPEGDGAWLENIF